MSFGYQPGNWNRSDDQLGRTPYIPPSQQQSFIDRYGRRCRIVCNDRPPNPQRDLRRIANQIIGLNLYEARRIYPNIRPVVINGQQQIVTQDFRQDRINVETRNNIITRVLGFY